MIALSDFMSGIRDNAARTKIYKQPGDGSGGECDCIGLIIGAKRLAGGKWSGLHGTNYAVRNELIGAGPIRSAGDLYVGEIVFKVREPGDKDYKLPEKYKQGGNASNGDYNDYYHVGIVTSVNPLEITHCTNLDPPIVRDRKLGRWSWGGALKGIDYGGTAPVKDEVREMVTLSGGNVKSPINMRENKSVLSKRIAEIPQNTEVELLEAGPEWSRVSYSGKTGYVLTKFVQSGSEDETGNGDTILVSRVELERAYDIIGDLLGLRG